MKFLAALVISLFLLGCVSTDEISVGISVVDEFGNSLENVRITFVPLNNNLASNVFTTNEDGLVNINIASGTYNVAVSKEGYFSAILEEYELTSEISELDFTLEQTG